jgi:hypothetical protein
MILKKIVKFGVLVALVVGALSVLRLVPSFGAQQSASSCNRCSAEGSRFGSAR